MNAKTRYSYEKRIKELEQRNVKLSNDLHLYRSLAMEIFSTISQLASEGKTISQGWLIGKFKSCLR